jgi:hypothetical protein
MTIDLELWEMNLILKALGKQPCDDVASTIQNIVEQAEKEEQHGN